MKVDEGPNRDMVLDSWRLGAAAEAGVGMRGGVRADMVL